MKKFFLVAFLAFAVCACAPTPVTRISYDYRESTARHLDAKQIMLSSPLIADISVSPNRIVYVEKEAFVDVVVDLQTLNKENLEAYKKLALARATRANDADVIVGAAIDVQTINERLVITISGFPAKYTNFRNVTKEEADLIKEVMPLQNNGGNAILSSPNKKDVVLLQGEEGQTPSPTKRSFKNF